MSELCAPWVGSLGRQTRVFTLSRPDGKLRQRCLRLLSKICKAHRITPAPYILRQDPINIGQVHHHSGFADATIGEYLGFSVAIKRLRTNQGDSDRLFKVPQSTLPITIAQRSAFTQRLRREIIGWIHLSHPNILPLLGVSASGDLHGFRILNE